MTSRSSGSRNDALQYALRLLGIRGRSTGELRYRLKKKGFTEEQTEETLRYLTERGFLDDRALARELVEYSQAVKGYGLKGVRDFLKKRGIEKNLIDELTSGLEEDINRATEIARRHYEQIKENPPEVIRRRLQGYLYRRGYNQNTIHEVFKRLHLL